MDVVEWLQERYTTYGQAVLSIFVMIVGVLVLLVGIAGLGGVMIQVGRMLHQGALIEPMMVVRLIDTIILLIIVVEILRNIIAYLEHVSVLPVIIDIAILAVARNIIVFRITDQSPSAVVAEAAAYTLLLIGLAVIYYIVKVKSPREDLQEQTEQLI